MTPMRIIYGAPDSTEDDGGIGRPYITYALNEDGTAPKFSDLLGFYPVKAGSQDGTYEADTDKDNIALSPGVDVKYTCENDASGIRLRRTPCRPAARWTMMEIPTASG